MTSGFQMDARKIQNHRTGQQVAGLLLITCLILGVAGCSQKRTQTPQFTPDCGPCQAMLQQIEYPDLECDEGMDGSELLTGPPMTISRFQELVPWELTIEECVELALANSKVMQKLGGVVVNSPQAVTTLYDQAIVETGGNSVEAALSAFDVQVTSGFLYNRSERQFNNPLLGGGAASQIANRSDFNFDISKQTANGTVYSMRNLTNYNRNNNPIFDPPDVPFGNLFGSVFDVVNQFEVRQPLGRGRGTTVNRIAGPNSQPGFYNGVLIARIRSDISLADFEAAVRDLVRDVEITYWELYFSYRDLDTKLTARESARVTWENRLYRSRKGDSIDRPDDEALARQQYYTFQSQAQNALTGTPNGQPGVLGSDRNLRRLMGMLASDGRVIRPVSDPALAPVTFDWEQSQVQALGRRVEIRRQKWTVRQRELELVAARALNKWRFDLVGLYGFRGFGSKLFGAGDNPAGGAVNDSIKGDLDDWQLGVELSGAIGNRTNHLAIRNAELNLVRERTLLKEQQRQILLDLNGAFTEVDRAMASLRTNFDSRVAAQEELEPKRDRFELGVENVFFVVDAEQRAATTESAVHRSVADYNVALMNYTYVTGTLLSRYNIHLAEGQWTDGAQQNAICKAPRYEQSGPNVSDRDTCPVSLGQFNQLAPVFGSDLDATDPGQVPGQPTMAPSEPAPSDPAPADGQTEERPTPDEETLGDERPSDIEIGMKDASDRLPRFNFNVPTKVASRYFESRTIR